MRNTIFKTLKKYSKRKYISFHMPGHKGGFCIPKNIKKNLYNIDTTELSYSDNLNNPKGILKELLEEISKEYGTKKSYLLVNGATQGIFSALFSSLCLNETVIILGECHISVINAIELIGAIPIFARTAEDLCDLFEKNRSIKALIFTYPTYYGFCIDADKIIKLSKEKKITVIVDEAHGSHFHYSDRLPRSTVELGADIVIHSMHKTLPVLTQVGLLHVNNNDMIEKTNKYMRYFATTSPSYIFIVSCEYGFSYMKLSGKIKLERVIRESGSIRGFNNITRIKNDDLTRIVLDVHQTGYTGFEISKILSKKFGIFVEMADYEKIVLIGSVANTKKDFNKLRSALVKLDKQKVDRSQNIEIDYSDLGKKATKNIVLYPPGTPLVLKGEIFTKESIEIMQRVIKMGGEVIEF